MLVNEFMIKYSKFYKKGVYILHSLQPILLGLFVCLFPPIQAGPTFLIFYIPIFFVFYFVFAVPLQLLFSLQPKAFHPLYLAAYLLIAMVVMLFFIDGIGSQASLPIIIMSSLIYWTCDSLFYQRMHEKNT